MGYKVQIPCKGCGKMFTPCADCVNDKSAFHWRAIACSPECAKKYFKAVEEARSKSAVKESPKAESSTDESTDEKTQISEAENTATEEVPVKKRKYTRKSAVKENNTDENLERIE